jgi:hypothetical protein
MLDDDQSLSAACSPSGPDSSPMAVCRTARRHQIRRGRLTSSGLVQYQNLTGTYAAVGRNGRIEVTIPDGLTRVIFIVSPTKIVYLTSDTGGYVGVFEQ